MGDDVIGELRGGRPPAGGGDEALLSKDLRKLMILSVVTALPTGIESLGTREAFDINAWFCFLQVGLEGTDVTK